MAGRGAAFEAIRRAFAMIAVRVEELKGKVMLVFLPSYRQAAMFAVGTGAIAVRGQKNIEAAAARAHLTGLERVRSVPEADAVDPAARSRQRARDPNVTYRMG